MIGPEGPNSGSLSVLQFRISVDKTRKISLLVPILISQMHNFSSPDGPFFDCNVRGGNRMFNYGLLR